MQFSLNRSIEIWKSTPLALESMLGNWSHTWLDAKEYEDGWSPKEIIAHLILGEKTDWLPRTMIFLSQPQEAVFEPFDMKSHLDYARTHDLNELLAEFSKLRKENIEKLISLNLSDAKLALTARHPEFGTVTLQQHLAAWTAHDMSHIAQIARIVAKQYKDETGPWVKYLSILNR